MKAKTSHERFVFDAVYLYYFLSLNEDNIISTAYLRKEFFDSAEQNYRKGGVRFRIRSTEAPGKPREYDLKVKVMDPADPSKVTTASAALGSREANRLSARPSLFLTKELIPESVHKHLELPEPVEIQSLPGICISRTYIGINDILVKVDQFGIEGKSCEQFELSICANDHQAAKKEVEEFLKNNGVPFTISTVPKYERVFECL